MARTLVLLGVTIGLVASAPPYATRVAAQGLPAQHDVPPVPGRIEVRAGIDRQRGWMVAQHKGLTLRKVSERTARSIVLDLQFRGDLVAVGVDPQGVITVARNGKSVTIDSPQALETVQGVLAGSEAVFAARLLHAERESTSDLSAPEMAVLSTTALVASLVGDVDAPRRLSDRFMAKHRGVYRPVRMPSNGSCWASYSTEANNAWNEMQACVDEANQDPSFFAGAYRRLACNGIWMLRAESAWLEYLHCLSPIGWK